jgi:hypothetical protein
MIRREEHTQMGMCPPNLLIQKLFFLYKMHMFGTALHIKLNDTIYIGRKVLFNPVSTLIPQGLIHLFYYKMDKYI